MPKPATKRPKRTLEASLQTILNRYGYFDVIRAITAGMAKRGMNGSVYTAMRNVIKKMDA